MAGGPAIERIGQIAIPVADLERAVAFYSEVLGLRSGRHMRRSSSAA